VSYTAITTQEIQVGGPVQNPTLAKIQANEDYFATQINALNSSLQSPRPIKFVVKGGGDGYTMPVNAFAYERVWVNITLTGAFIFVPVAGISGSVQINVEYKRGAGAWTSIFSTQPVVPSSSGDLAISSSTGGCTAAVLSTTALLSGDFLRLNIVSDQSGCKEFQVELPFNYT